MLRGDPVTTNSRTVSFDSTLTATGNNTGIVVPVEVLTQLGAGKRPPLDVEINGYRYRTTVGVMAGQSLVSVSAAIRKSTGLAAGDLVHVTLAVNETAQDVEIPLDLADALKGKAGTENFFASLPNSLQRYHVDNINGAKTDETRQRRIDKTVALFFEGKKR